MSKRGSLLWGTVLLVSCNGDGVPSPGDVTAWDLSMPRDAFIRPDLAAARDLAGPPDLSASTDLLPSDDLATPPDLTPDAGCAPGKRLCGMRCIDANGCCGPNDCAAFGATCQNEACVCPMGTRPCLSECIPNANCCLDAECMNTACFFGRCQSASCYDGLKNGQETDVDCGGGCALCETARSCLAAADCRSGLCQAGVCAAATGFETKAYGVSGVAHLSRGDLDGDGKLDLVAASSTSGNLTVLLGRGDGTFTLKGPFATGGYPRMTAVADFNGDQRPDVASLDGTRLVSVLLGDGKGGLGLPIRTPLAASSSDLVTGDFNEDGAVDLMVDVSGDSALVFFAGKGDGTFRAPVMVTREATDHLTVADFDGDGHLDVAQAGGLGTVDIAWGHGDGRFTGGTHLKVGQGVQSLAAADLDGDGLVDLLAGSTTINPFRNLGQRTFMALANFGRDSYNFLAVADLDGNNLPDVIGRDGSFANGGNLAFGKAVKYQPTGYWAVAGDFNSDGLTDAALAAVDGTVVVLFGKGDGTLGNLGTTVTDAAPFQVGQVTLGDWNGDGRADVIGAGSLTRTLEILSGQKNGTLGAPVVIRNVGTAPQVVVSGDFNGDGFLDVAAGNGVSNPDFTVVLGGKNGVAMSMGSVATGGEPMERLAVADVDGDGRLDVVGGSYGSKTISSFLGIGNGSFSPNPKVSTANTTVSHAIVTDLDGDARPDLVYSVWNDFGWMRGAGDGTFGKPVALPTMNIKNGGNLVSGDLDGDRKTDLVLINENSTSVMTLCSRSNLAMPISNVDAAGPYAVVTADFDRDGKLDVATVNSLDGRVGLYRGNGDGTLKAPLYFSIGASHTAIAAGDVDGDGKIDLVTSGLAGNIITVLLNTL